jgi:hypothetical protein
MLREGVGMADSLKSGGPRGMAATFWILISLVVVGLALMIVLPLAGR